MLSTNAFCSFSVMQLCTYLQQLTACTRFIYIVLLIICYVKAIYLQYVCFQFTIVDSFIWKSKMVFFKAADRIQTLKERLLLDCLRQSLCSPDGTPGYMSRFMKRKISKIIRGRLSTVLMLTTQPRFNQANMLINLLNWTLSWLSYWNTFEHWGP